MARHWIQEYIVGPIVVAAIVYLAHGMVGVRDLSRDNAHDIGEHDRRLAILEEFVAGGDRCPGSTCSDIANDVRHLQVQQVIIREHVAQLRGLSPTNGHGRAGFGAGAPAGVSAHASD